MKLSNIDQGQEFDWGKATTEYARYRDIYPISFFEKLLSFGIAKAGQKVLDLGSGTGVLPRAMYQFGAQFYATDISETQLNMGRKIAESQGMKIHWQTAAAENLDFQDNFFDAATAMTCWFYFNTEQVVPMLHRMLKSTGRLSIGYLSWLSDESSIAKMSENLVCEFNPRWTGIGVKRIPLTIPSWLKHYFDVETLHTYDELLPFTYESWNGRIKASRGVGASLTPEKVEGFHHRHLDKLRSMTQDHFYIPHQIILEVYRVKK